MQKLFDLAVKTGEYTKNGELKASYENIGSVMEGDKGQFIFLKRTFNPAGVQFKEGSDTIFVSMFEPRSKDGNDKPSKPKKNEPPAFDEADIPF